MIDRWTEIFVRKMALGKYQNQNETCAFPTSVIYRFWVKNKGEKVWPMKRQMDLNLYIESTFKDIKVKAQLNNYEISQF